MIEKKTTSNSFLWLLLWTDIDENGIIIIIIIIIW